MRNMLFFICIFYFSGILAQIFTLSSDDARKIGDRIWKNECNGTIEGLTSWHANEQFASLGIGHFIWFPSGSLELFKEQFPAYVKFAYSKSKLVPCWLMTGKKSVISCPWKNKQEFDAAVQSEKMKELRLFLSETIDLQIQFIIETFKKSLDTVLHHGPKKKQLHIAKQLRRLLSTSQGVYVLIDYVNFKGAGLATSEQYGHVGWGLVQVLERMSGDVEGSAAVEEFVSCAKKVLESRVASAPAEKHEEKFLKGWCNRLDSYLNFK